MAVETECAASRVESIAFAAILLRPTDRLVSALPLSTLPASDVPPIARVRARSAISVCRDDGRSRGAPMRVPAAELSKLVTLIARPGSAVYRRRVRSGGGLSKGCRNGRIVEILECVA